MTPKTMRSQLAGLVKLHMGRLRCGRNSEPGWRALAGVKTRGPHAAEVHTKLAAIASPRART